MNIFMIGIAILIAGIVLFSFIISHVSLKPFHRKKNKTPGHYELPYEEVYFTSAGKKLHGWMIKQPNGDRRPLLVLLHGWESNAQGMLPHAKYLYDHGFNLFLYDARGHGNSDPVSYMNLVRMTEDAENALAYLKTRPDVDPNRIALYGHSMGAATAITAASRQPQINAVVASSSFAQFEAMTRDMFRRYHLPYFPFGYLCFIFWKLRFDFDLHDWAPGRNIRKIQAPVLIAHGMKDEVLSYDHFEHLWLALQAPVRQQLLIEEGTHRNLYEFKSYQDTIVKFLKENFYDVTFERQSA